MKIKTVAVTALIVGLSSFASAGSVYSPSKGVICDKKSGFCSDSYGISIGMTKDYLGQKAADKFTKILSEKDFDATIYTMSNGLTCDTKKKICKKSKWDEKADAHWTKILFGKKARHHNKHGCTDRVQVTKPYEITAHHGSEVVVHALVTPSTDGHEYTHTWTQVAGPTVALTTTTRPTTSLVVPAGATQTIVLQHTVTNRTTGKTTVTRHKICLLYTSPSPRDS